MYNSGNSRNLHIGMCLNSKHVDIRIALARQTTPFKTQVVLQIHSYQCI